MSSNLIEIKENSNEDINIDQNNLRLPEVKNSNNLQNSEVVVNRPKHKKFPRTYINILHDPRVVKGNTYAAFVIPSSLQLEFLRLKEEEERRIKLMSKPTKLPRVAGLTKSRGRVKKELEFYEDNLQKNEYIEIKKKDSKSNTNNYNQNKIDDEPYFYIDKAPTPVSIIPSPGKTKATQIDDLDMDLFDFDLEVQPILQVLVGRTLIISRYELIEQQEREEYLKYSKINQKNREYELNKLQKEEASRLRRDKEIELRENQKKARHENDVVIQKKFYSRAFSKFLFKRKIFLDNSIKSLADQGYFNKRNNIKILNNVVNNSIYPSISKLSIWLDLRKEVYNKLEITNIIKDKHKHSTLMNTVFKDRETEKIRIEKELHEKAKEDERILNEKNIQKEKKRKDKFTKLIESSILDNKNKIEKIGVESIELADMDDFYFKGMQIYTVGGLFGEILIVFQSLYEKIIKKYLDVNNITDKYYDINNNNDNNEEEESNLNNETFDFKKYFSDLFIKYLEGLKDNEFLTLKYIENKKHNHASINIPSLKNKLDIDNLEEVNKVNNLKLYVLNEDKFYSKSIKVLLEHNIISKDLFKIILNLIVDISFRIPIDVNSEDIKNRINPEPDNKDEEYIQLVNKKTEVINNENNKYEELKKKIKFNFVKSDDIEKMYKKTIGLIKVNEFEDFKEQYNEVYIQSEDEYSDKVKNNSNNDNNISINEKVDENELKEPVKSKQSKNAIIDSNAQNLKLENKQTIINIPYNNKAYVFRNSNIIGNCLISHRNITDYHKIKILKNITQEFRRYYKPYYKEKQEKKLKELENERQLRKELKESQLLGAEKQNEIENTSDNYINNEQYIDNKLEIKKSKVMDSKSNLVTPIVNNRITKIDSKNDKLPKTNVPNTNIIPKHTKSVLESMDQEEDFDKPLVVEEELYSSKMLLDIVKEKYAYCQKFIEDYYLDNIKFYSEKRKKHYDLVSIEVNPPKNQEEIEETK